MSRVAFGLRATHEVGERVLVLHNWDRLRVFAALDIVGFHLTGRHALAGFGLPLFLMVSVALAVSKPRPSATSTFLARRVERILVPWAFWAFLLAVLRCGYASSQGQEPFAWANWRMLLYGPQVHLWFLPAVVAAAFGAHQLHRLSDRQQPLISALPALCVGAALLVIPLHVRLDYPFRQWCFALPAVGVGYAVGRVLCTERHDLARLRVLLTTVYALFVLFAAALLLGDASAKPVVVRYLGGAGLLVAAVWFPNRNDPLTKHLTPLMLGVYILHPLVWRALVRPALELARFDMYASLHVLLTFPLTLLAVWLMRQTRLQRVL